MTTQALKNREAYDGLGPVLIPVVDISENDNEYIMKFEMPGVSREEIAITLENNELEIKGTVASGQNNGPEVLYSEFTLHDYYRKFRVNDDIDTGRVEARLDQGILTITLHKREELKPRKIEVKAH